MPNTCFIKVSGGRILTQWRTDQNYEDFDQTALDILAYSNETHGESRTMVAHACGDSDLLKAAFDAGAEFCDGPDCDFDVILKSAVTTETVVPPEGVIVDDIPDADYVVCHA